MFLVKKNFCLGQIIFSFIWYLQSPNDDIFGSKSIIVITYTPFPNIEIVCKVRQHLYTNRFLC